MAGLLTTSIPLSFIPLAVQAGVEACMFETECCAQTECDETEWEGFLSTMSESYVLRLARMTDDGNSNSSSILAESSTITVSRFSFEEAVRNICRGYREAKG